MTDKSEPVHVDEEHTDLRRRPPTGELIANGIRGGLIGVAETIPGVSGGTIALITGIYARLIGAAKHLTDVAKALLTRGDWRAELRKIDWWLLITVGVGAVVVVALIAGHMKSFVENHTVTAYALFMGMIAMSVVIRSWRSRQGPCGPATRRSRRRCCS